MKNLSIRLIMYCFVAMVPVSCGIRKVSKDLQEGKVKANELNKSTGSVSTDYATSKMQQELNAYKKLSEMYSGKVTELFDENGKLKERVSEYGSKKEDESSSVNRSLILMEKKRIDSVFNTTNQKNVVITERRLIKNTEADKSLFRNIGPWNIALIIIIFAGLCFYLFRKGFQD